MVEATTDEDGEPIFLTSEPKDGQEAYQRELPMGRPAGHGWELPRTICSPRPPTLKSGL